MDRIHTVICGFYDAALEPGRWEAAFEGLGDLLGGCAMGSSLQSGKGLDSVLALSRLDPHYTRVLHDYYATPDTNPMVAVMGNLPSSRAFARALVKPDADYRRSGLYNDVFRPQGLEHAAVACVLRSGDRFAPLGVFNRAGQEFGNEELKILDLAAPHIEKALHVHLRIGGSEAMRDATGHALDHLPVGTVFVAPDGSIRGMNRIAEDVLRKGDGLWARGNRLRTSLASEERRLYGLLASAIGTAEGDENGSGGWMAISRPSGSRALGVLVAPLPARDFWPGGEAGAVVFVSDPDLRIAPEAEALTEILGLTPAQARIASLLAIGLTLEEAADRTGVTVHTARVHLKQAFERTSTSRQSDLVRSVLSSVASLSAR